MSREDCQSLLMVSNLHKPKRLYHQILINLIAGPSGICKPDVLARRGCRGGRYQHNKLGQLPEQQQTSGETEALSMSAVENVCGKLKSKKQPPIDGFSFKN